MTRGGTRPGAGRPKSTTGGTGSNLTVRLDDAHRAIVDRMAVQLRTTTSEVVRRSLRVFEELNPDDDLAD